MKTTEYMPKEKLPLDPFWKLLARKLSETCEKCGNSRLYSVFDAYISEKRPNCMGCSALYTLSLPFIKYLFNKTNIEKSRVKALLSDTLVRKSMLNVVRGIHHFGIRIPQPTAVPTVIVWNYTNHCNLNCLHCHQDAGEDGEEELTTGQRFEIVDKISDAGVSILTFSGGEPLVQPDIFDIIAYANEKGLLCTIASNGTLMTKGVVQQLKESGITRVEIGLDGCNAETHEFLKNSPNCFDATIQGIKNCVEEEFDEICATMTLHSQNANGLSETITLAEELGVERFYLNRLIPAGRGKDIPELDVTTEQKIKALECIYEKFYQSAINGEGIQCYARGMTYYGRMGYERSNGRVFTVSEALSGYSKMWTEKFGDSISKLVKKYAPWFGGCSAGITYAGLTASGDLLPCVPAPIPLGNLLQEDLEDLWVHNKLLNYIRQRDELKGACGRCSYNSLCGGCRYTAYVLNGDWLEADPSCPFGPSDKNFS